MLELSLDAVVIIGSIWALAALVKWITQRPVRAAPTSHEPQHRPPPEGRGPPDSPSPAPSMPPRPPSPFSPGAAVRPLVLARLGFEDDFRVPVRRLERLAA